jgi:hypothetical protein
MLCAVADGGSFGGLATDIGPGGSRIECMQVPGLGDELTLAARLPCSPDLSRLVAVVRWIGPGAFGVQFIRLDAREQALIDGLLGEPTPGSAQPN